MSKGPKNWLKGVLSNQSETVDERSEWEIDLDLASNPKESSEKEENNPQTETAAVPQNNILFQREDMDKITLDMVVSVENLLKDRQLVLINNHALKEHLHNAYENINKLKDDVAKQEQIIRDKNIEYSRLEDKLTTKQMNYDQLLENYKEYQYTSNNEFESLKIQLEKETNKYKRLNEEFTNYQYQNMQVIKGHEEKIRDLEAENLKINDQLQKVIVEKNQLLDTFSDFSERLSFSLSNKNQPKVPTPSEE
jgi:hypothetical protein